MSLSNYPPGVTGNEPQIAGEKFPPGIEDLLQTEVVFPNGEFREGSVIVQVRGDQEHVSRVTLARSDLAEDWSNWEEVGVVEEYEPWEEGDEDGMHGGVTVTIRNARGRTATVEQGDLQRLPEEPS